MEIAVTQDKGLLMVEKSSTGTRENFFKVCCLIVA